MGKQIDYEELAERLAAPDHDVKSTEPALRDEEASKAGREFLLEEYGSERAIHREMKRGRPKLGQSAGESPAVRGRLSRDDYEAFKRLEQTTGRSQSDLVREAVHKLLAEHHLAS